MPIHIGTSVKNQQQIALGLTQMQKVYVGDKLVWQKILASIGGYGMLYNWFCTQEQASVENGYLYNWYAVQNIARSGWHVPTDAEWNTLITYLGGSSISGGKLKETGLLHWNAPNTGATNEVGFNARGGGVRTTSASFSSHGDIASYWFANEYNTSNAYYAYLSTNNTTSTSSNTIKQSGCSVRLVCDSETDPGFYLGNDLKMYKTIKIGTQVWLSENLMETLTNTGVSIAEATTALQWSGAITGARCSYNNVESNAGSTKKLSSSDSFIVPSSSIWNALTSFLGGSGADFAGGKLKEAGLAHWDSPNTGATNEVGFNGVGSSYRSSYGNFPIALKTICLLHASDHPLTETYLYEFSLDKYGLYGNCIEYIEERQAGLSIRLCNPTTSHANGYVGSYTQNDGTVISTIVINGIEWTMNLKETKWSDGTDIQNVTDNTAWSLLQSAACCDINNDPTNR